MVRIGIVGCGRILNAHLQGYQRLRRSRNLRLTARPAPSTPRRG